MKLTQQDLDAIKELVGIEIDEILEQKLEEKLKNFPTKEEFFSRMDDVMGELKAIREIELLLLKIRQVSKPHKYPNLIYHIRPLSIAQGRRGKISSLF